MKKAIIDVGSNSVRLLLWADGTTLYKKILTTRLGEGIAHSSVLKEEAIMRTAEAVRLFSEEGQRAGAEVFVFATAAVRSAKNGADFCARVKRVTGLEVDVVSGEEEANLALTGALGHGDGAIIDIGGASTEVCVRAGGKKTFSTSLDIGAVRLFDLCGDDPEKLSRAVANAVFLLKGVCPQGRVVAVGGTATTLAALKLQLTEYNAAAVQDLPLSIAEVRQMAETLLSMRTEERKRLPGMDPRRADIIAGAAYLLFAVMASLNIEMVEVSDRDNLEGYLYGRVLA